MAKILCNYFGLSMAADGKSEFVGRQAAAFLGYVQQDAERCAENCGCAEELSAAPEQITREILRTDEELRRRAPPAPGGRLPASGSAGLFPAPASGAAAGWAPRRHSGRHRGRRTGRTADGKTISGE